MTPASPSDSAAWMRAVLDRFEEPLTRYAARLTGDVDSARDVVQETFLRFCGNGAPRDESRTAQWLFTVCRNQAVSIRRKDKRMRPLTDQLAQSCPAADATPAAGAERRETASRVLGMLAQLPEKQQEAIRLRFQNGLSYREISGVMDLTVTNVGYLIHTAIKTIRERMGARIRLNDPGTGGMS